MKDKQTTQVATIMPNIFGDIDFSTLNKTIIALGNSSKQLGEKEKEFAIEAINTWEYSIIERLRDKEQEANIYIEFLDINSRCFAPFELSKENIELLIEAVGLQDLYQEYLDKMREYESLSCPEEPVIDLSTTLMEQMKARTDYELQRKVWDTTKTKLNREAYNIMRKIKVEMNNKPEVQELLARLKKYKRNVSKFRNECVEKSQLAKINVTISSDEVRESLKELLNFSVTI